MTRYLLQQWTIPTIEEERRIGGHGQALERAASNFDRFEQLEPGDVVYPAAVRSGSILPIARLVVDNVADYDDLMARGIEPSWPSRWQATARAPLPRTNNEHAASLSLARQIVREDGTPLARTRGGAIAGQAFRTPLWISPESAALLDEFLRGVWKGESDEGLEDPELLLRGQGVRMSQAERKAIELRAMEVARKHYEERGWSVLDTSAGNPYDLEISKGRVTRRVEVKGTVGGGDSVLITRGEYQSARSHPTDLFIVTGVQLDRRTKRASGGSASVVASWSPSDADCEPTVYRHFVRP